ncbi:CYTH domain-containing protein [Mesonia sp. K7]|uniref:CYTH domain-containing protein n=1 Tax=Mesonia sp. K7 TaxID=2218606 RepID=UPI000DA8DB1F|nr:CYTH domain-containing protein [Mesonia sp. K7]PZD79052.1 adenylate cyclase [Mesonia sp. K7]
MQEIERKFLVKNQGFMAFAKKQFSIKQGYLSSHPERSVRIRITENQAFLTIKGKSSASGMSRFEWEKKIDTKEAEQLFALCENGCVVKTRYLVTYKNHIFEVDVFEEENQGLIIAEVELENENEIINLPDWIGEEVTGDQKYYNAYLSKQPFKTWKS